MPWASIIRWPSNAASMPSRSSCWWIAMAKSTRCTSGARSWNRSWRNCSGPPANQPPRRRHRQHLHRLPLRPPRLSSQPLRRPKLTASRVSRNHFGSQTRRYAFTLQRVRLRRGRGDRTGGVTLKRGLATGPSREDLFCRSLVLADRHAFHFVALADRVHDVLAFGHAAKHGVLAVQMRASHVSNEEL